MSALYPCQKRGKTPRDIFWYNQFMKNPANNSIQIELHVPDFELVKEFYGKLGLEIVWERKPEEKKGYLVIKKDNNILCFWPGNENVEKQSYFQNFPSDTKRGYGVEIVIMVGKG